VNVLLGVDIDSTAARAAVLTGLKRYNEGFLGPTHHASVAVTARDEGGMVVGGAVGAVYCDRLTIELVWVAEERRGQRLGSLVLQATEAEARRLGATRAYLDTFGFEAATFYEKQGCREAARISDYRDDYDRIYLTKDH